MQLLQSSSQWVHCSHFIDLPPSNTQISTHSSARTTVDAFTLITISRWPRWIRPVCTYWNAPDGTNTRMQVPMDGQCIHLRYKMRCPSCFGRISTCLEPFRRIIHKRTKPNDEFGVSSDCFFLIWVWIIAQRQERQNKFSGIYFGVSSLLLTELFGGWVDAEPAEPCVWK